MNSQRIDFTDLKGLERLQEIHLEDIHWIENIQGLERLPRLEKWVMNDVNARVEPEKQTMSSLSLQKYIQTLQKEEKTQQTPAYIFPSASSNVLNLQNLNHWETYWKISAQETKTETIRIERLCGVKTLVFSDLKELKSLSLLECDTLQEIVFEGTFPSLVHLQIRGCFHLRTIEGFSSLRHLFRVEIESENLIFYPFKSDISIQKGFISTRWVQILF